MSEPGWNQRKQEPLIDDNFRRDWELVTGNILKRIPIPAEDRERWKRKIEERGFPPNREKSWIDMKL